jgi:hypothetical protein
MNYTARTPSRPIVTLAAGLALMATASLGGCNNAGEGALTGAGIGAVAGGLIGGLTNLGVPEAEAHYYAEAVRRGGILVSVAADSQAEADSAAEVMRRHGAVDIDERATEWKKQGWKGRFETEGDTGRSRAAEERSIPVTQEELAIGKRTVEPGGVRVYSRVMEEQTGASNQPRYSGPERRMSSAPYRGAERRRAA